MKLQGRELKPRMFGDDVKLLHTELQQLGYTLPDVELSQQFYGDATEAAVRQFQKKQNLPVTGSVDHQTAAAINQAAADREPFIVQGRVMYSDGAPVANAVVRAFDKGLCEEKLLGEARVSSGGLQPPVRFLTTFNFPGFYKITYTRDDLVRPEKGAANLVVRAYEGEQQIAESPVIFKAKKEESVDLIVGNEEFRGPSDFTSVKPVVERICEDKSIKDLTGEEIQFIANDTGLEMQKIVTLVQAEKLAADTQYAHPEIFYALGRQNLPIHSRTAILAQSPSVLRTSLESAVRDNVISARQLEAAGGIDGVLAKFKELIVEHAFLPPEVEGKYNLSQLLTATTRLNKCLQRRFLTLYVNYEGSLPEFWKKVEQDPELKPSVPKLQFGLQLGALTGNHVPLVQHLQKKAKLKSLRDAARFTREDWLRMIEITGTPPDVAGDSEEEKKQKYAEQLTRTVEDAFPTAVIANRLQGDTKAPFTGARKDNLVQFFSTHTDFEFSQHAVDDYIAERGLQIDAGLRQDLKAMQRVYKIVPNFERWSSIRPLLAAKLDSAHRIALMDRAQFTRQVGAELGEEKAAEIYNNARQVAATALNLYAMFSAEYNNIQLPVIRDQRVMPNGNSRPAKFQLTSGSLPGATDVTETENGGAVTESGGTVTTAMAVTAADTAAAMEIPDWVSLFGPFHLCECEHCRSVYSPAAYLVDILHFLEGIAVVQKPPPIAAAPGTEPSFPDTERFLSSDPVTFGHGKLSDKTATLFRSHVFAISEDGRLRERYWKSPNWSWHLHNYKQVKGRPVFIGHGNILNYSSFIEFRLYLFLQGKDGKLWIRFWNGYKWKWESTDQNIDGEPAVVAHGDSSQVNYTNLRLRIFFRGADGKLKEGIRNNSGWTWNNHDSRQIKGRPAVLLLGNTASIEESDIAIRVFVRGDDNKLLERRWDGSNWAWIDHQKEIKSDPVLIAFGDTSRMDGQDLILFLLALDKSDSLQLGYWDGSQWQWTDSGKKAYGNPTVFIWGDSTSSDAKNVRISVFVRDTNMDAKGNSLLWEWHWDGTSWAWMSTGKRVAGEPAIFTFGDIAELSGKEMRQLLYVRNGEGKFHLRYWDGDHWAWIKSNFKSLDKLLERRADLGEVHLNCQNTNTVLPYIDLVNEILEDAVVSISQNNTPVIAGRQTTGAADILNISPEHINQLAYDILSAAIFPSSLPFNLPLEQARIFLDHLGVSRWRLMQAFQKADGSEPTDLDIAGEYLGLSTKERQIITGTLSPAPKDWEFWGLDSNWLSTLRQVPEFLERSGLSFQELEQLLNTRFINPDRFVNKTTGILIQFPGTDCDLSGAVFKRRQGEDRTDPRSWQDLDAPAFTAALNKMHRFIRLWRKLGWTMQELDMALAAMHAGTPDTWEIDEAFIKKLAVIQRLHQELKRPVVEILSWWANLETTDYNYDSLPAQTSFYEQLFLNEALVKPLDPVFELDASRTELENTSEQISKHVPALVAVLRISEAELATLQENLSLTTLNLANLSTLYRHVSLARALRLSIPDYLTAKALLGDPFDSRNPGKILTFIDHLKTIRRSSFEADELAYLMLHRSAPGNPVAPDQKEIQLFLEELRDGLQKIHQQFLPLDKTSDSYAYKDPQGIQTKEKLATILPNEADLQIAMAIIAGTAGKTADEQEKFIQKHGLFETVTVVAKLDDNDQEDAIDRLFTTIVDNTNVLKQHLVESSHTNYLDPDTKLNKRFEYVLQLVIGYLLRTATEQFAIQKLSDEFQLETAVSERLGKEWLKSVSASNPPALDDFADWNFYSTTGELTPAQAQNQNNAYIRWHKCAMLISGFRLSEAELEVLFSHAGNAGWMDMNDLPLDISGRPVAFDKWAKLAMLFGFRDGLRLEKLAFATMLQQAIRSSGMTDDQKNSAKEAFLQSLSEHTGWSMQDLESLVGNKDDHTDTGRLGLIIPATTNIEAIFSRLQACFDLIRRTGAAAPRFAAWRKADLTFEDAAAIRQTVKARYDDKQWLKIARPLQDVLREKQRDALVAWLIGNDDRFDSPNDLHAYFLIDTQMSACQMTSRIKQAISSVQLFVQRCLMNLEPDVKIESEKARQWEWMKNYRVWEANRKVFLYPENWIEPELRDNKSPFFIDLENELLQNEITAETVEQAYRNYLEKLDQVARLEMMGMYEEKEGDRYVLHVFGRSFNTPHIYFYRRWIDKSYWTPWERVDLDIEGDHLIPVVWNGRLYLFWPIFTEKAVEKELPATNFKGEKPEKYWEIKLAWSEYKNGKWAGKMMSNHVLDLSEVFDISDSRFSDFRYTDRKTFLLRAFGRSHLKIEIALAPPTYDENSDLLLAELKFDDCSSSLTLSYLTRSREKTSTIEDPPLYGTEFQYGAITEKQGEYQFAVVYSETYPFSYIILENTPETFTIIYPFQRQFKPYISETLFFYADDTHTFFVIPFTKPNKSRITELESTGDPFLDFVLGFLEGIKEALRIARLTTYRFHTFYHPYICEFVKQLNLHGIEGLLQPTSVNGQRTLHRQLMYSEPNYFKNRYNPADAVQKPYPVEDIDFEFEGSYSLYNWELFFHIPLLIADCLRKNQRFADAVKWFHYIFNPMEPPVSGLMGFYFDNMELKGEPVLVRNDKTIDFDWGERGAPDPAIEFDTFSVRWVGTIVPQYTETYTFYTETDDGVRLWIDNRLIIDKWQDQPLTEHQASIALTAGKPYHLKMEYYENRGRAAAFLRWSSPSTPKQIIPENRMYNISYWQIRPSFEHEQVAPLDQLLKLLTVDLSGTPDAVRTAVENLCKQITQWRKNPFNPHLIARMRITPYMKAVVIKYIETLIAWGDQLFRRDTIESINEATQLYILAAEILGPRPESIPPRQQNEQTETYNTLHSRLDELSNALIGVEERVSTALACPAGTIEPISDTQPWLGLSLYFCIPRNDYLLKYWDTVEDRLFKIRHCMNIEGVVRQLPLFQPPIEPGLLVRAAAMGVDLSSALNDIYAGLPHYRFQFTLQKAIEFCNDVRNLGGALLSALEKRDAEALALLCASQETALLEKVKAIKESQIDEAEETLEGLQRSKELTTLRRDYYRDIEKLSQNERQNLDNLRLSHIYSMIAQGIQAGVAAAHAVPNFDVGTAGWAASPVVKASFGGNNLGSALQAAAGVLNMIAAQYSHQANMASIKGGYDRRWDDWKLQERLAEKELEQLDKQIAAAEIRKTIAEKDLQNHETQIENARKVETFMKEKFTNRELYDWMIGQISPIFFQSYQMAYDLAKRAEKAFQHETGQYDKTFIKFGYWDNLKKGLLAGDKLYHDLKRMEKAYMDQHKREYELTKSISLALLDPIALIKLKKTGECFVNLPEEIFDLDYPGHYFRRLKNVRLTIPCVTGPHTTVNCTLTLLSNSIRIDPSVPNDYKRSESGDDPRFRDNVGAIQSIATSTAQNDSGLFELNFRDERYLPFEGAGAISSWRIELTTDKDLRQFDHDTITDCILHLSYTAREGGVTLKEKAVQALIDTIEDGLLKLANEDGLLQMFSLRHEFPNQWHRFLHPVGDGAPHVMEMDISQERFPFMFQEKEITISEAILYLKLKNSENINGTSSLTINSGTSQSLTFSATNGLPEARHTINDQAFGKWTLQFQNEDANKIEDIWLVVKYKASLSTSF